VSQDECVVLICLMLDAMLDAMRCHANADGPCSCRWVWSFEVHCPRSIKTNIFVEAHPVGEPPNVRDTHLWACTCGLAAIGIRQCWASVMQSELKSARAMGALRA
jgi:hypothetical protein